MTKTFLALPPLALLALHKALDSRCSRWWTLVVAAVLFLLLFHNLYQLVFTGLAFVFFTVAHLLLVPGATAGHPASQEWRSKVEERRAVLRRAVLTVVVIVLLVGPFTLPFIQVALDTTVTVDANLQSLNFQPDAVELFLPPSFTQFWGAGTVESLEQADVDAFNIESNVYLTWTALILSVVAFFRGPRRARPWILFSLLCALLALGPVLQWLGQRTFTEYEVRILLPYAWLTGLPGFDFMRAPGRFMMIGSVALAISAAFGLAWLLRRYPQHALLVTLAATAFALIEVWPRPWPQEALAPVPDFYLQIAADEEMYGVFDLPVKPEEDVWFAEHAAYFQRYQIEHHKGIASGYLARTYTSHPMFPCVIPELREPSTDVLVDGEPADCAANILYDLATYNYRYIVYHKVDLHRATVSPAWGRAQARQFVDAYLEGYEPLVDDELVTVYSVPPLEELSQELSPTLGLLDNWYRLEREGNASWRWAQSPATIFLSIPRAQQFVLKVTPGVMFAPDADSERVRGFRGRIKVELNGELLDNLAIRTGRPFAVELDLPAGIHTVALSLEAGNFQAADYEGLGDDRRQLSFTIRSIELITAP